MSCPVERQPVLLVASDDSLLALCSAELGEQFPVQRAGPSGFTHALDTLQGCCGVLLDGACMEEIELVSACHVIAEDYGLPVVLLSMKGRRLSGYLEDISGKVAVMDVFFRAGALREFICAETDSAAEFPEEDAELPDPFPPPGDACISTASFIMSHFYERIKKASQTDDNILLLGESGSGKSWTARKIHELSPRRTKKFFKVNVAEFNANLIESNLFGTTSGAFTDAADQNGVFSAADGGTLFLDEIGELPVLLQSKLLGVLETHSYRRLGSTQECTFDEKIIFATNRNLEECIKAGTFRKDLYYRISSIVLEVPPLRDHPEDIPEISRSIAKTRNKLLSQGAVDKLMEYAWPGNIRELESIVKRACIFSSADIISADDIHFS